MFQKKQKTKKANLLGLTKPYLGFISLILLLTLAGNIFNLILPKLIASALDSFNHPGFQLQTTIIIFISASSLIFLLALLQSILQTYLSERIAKDLRNRFITKVSEEQFSFILKVTPEKLLTNLTSDIDNIKQVIALGLSQIFSSIIIIFGASALLLSINLHLALIVLLIIPIIAVIFFLLFSRIRKYFLKAQGVIDKLNKTINESIIAASLIRIVNAQNIEFQKFSLVSEEAKDIGLSILRLFSSLIPLIGLCANATVVTILFLGGTFIVNGTFTIGQFTAFNSYISMLIFPIIIIGFISNALARASVSFDRITEVLDAPPMKARGKLQKNISGAMDIQNVNLSFGQKQILKDISFSIPAGSRTAILGPTAAGKTQLFYLIAGLIDPTSGDILFDSTQRELFDPKILSDQVGLVFQDSSMFNTSLHENISFKDTVSEEILQKAIATAELQSFIQSLPEGLDTKIAERGASLSGGQKQRVTLARALVLNPKLLLLDDFTARVDKETEKKIFTNLKENYAGTTQILITQQIASIVDFDQVILLMEGEILAKGTHDELLHNSIEYQQIFKSQQSVS